MPAAIAEVDGKPMIAYQGEMPWHKLGTKCDSLKSVDAALKAAHIAWKVKSVQLGYQISGEKIEVPRKVLIRADKPKHWLSTVGMDYEIMQNEDAFALLEPACDKLGVTIETAGALGPRGDRVWMLGKLPKSFHPVEGDRVDGYFLVLTGHNGWTSLTARPTPVRVVCANTLALAVSGDKAIVNLRHTKSGAAQLDEAAEMVTKLVKTLKETNESFAQLASKKLTPNEVREYINRVLGVDDNAKGITASRRDTIVELAATGKGVEFAPSTAWAAFNAVTEYVDHVRPAEAKSPRTIAQANQSALFGTNAKLKMRALTMARQLAA